jgi:hypothetical protein
MRRYPLQRKRWFRKLRVPRGYPRGSIRIELHEFSASNLAFFIMGTETDAFFIMGTETDI